MTALISPRTTETLSFIDTVPVRRSVSRNVVLAPCIALVGCDGSGKSTLARDLTALLDPEAPTRSIYLGLGTGDLGRGIGRIPLVGTLLERFLTVTASKAHAGADKRLPGLATALVMYAFSLARRRRFRQVLALRRRGIRVISDRYPQAELPGRFDGPGLTWTRRGSAVVERLADRERHLYEAMAAYRPTLVIRLNIDVDTALARKADHRRDLLETKLAMVPTLKFGGARIVDVDATRPYPDVLAAVHALVQVEALAA
jgi:energy-coupling factor transporter ATP-binding protein EcfA2